MLHKRRLVLCFYAEYIMAPALNTTPNLTATALLNVIILGARAETTCFLGPEASAQNAHSESASFAGRVLGDKRSAGDGLAWVPLIGGAGATRPA